MIKIALIGFLGIFVSLILKHFNSKFSSVVSVFVSISIIMLLYDDIVEYVNVFKLFETNYGISGEYIKLLLKILGISFVTQFVITTAEDCGERLIAKKIELAGRVFTISLVLPTVVRLLNEIIGLL